MTLERLSATLIVSVCVEDFLHLWPLDKKSPIRIQTYLLQLVWQQTLGRLLETCKSPIAAISGKVLVK